MQTDKDFIQHRIEEYYNEQKNIPTRAGVKLSPASVKGSSISLNMESTPSAVAVQATTSAIPSIPTQLRFIDVISLTPSTPIKKHRTEPQTPSVATVKQSPVQSNDTVNYRLNLNTEDKIKFVALNREDVPQVPKIYKFHINVVNKEDYAKAFSIVGFRCACNGLSGMKVVLVGGGTDPEQDKKVITIYTTADTNPA